MIKIIVVTHGTMSDGIKDAVDTIVGMSEGITTLNLLSGKDVGMLELEITKYLEENIEQHEIIIFTDLVSASPYNQSLLSISKLNDAYRDKVYVIGGVNLPMVLEAVNHMILGTEFSEAVKCVEEQGHGGISIWSSQNLEVETDDDF